MHTLESLGTHAPAAYEQDGHVLALTPRPASARPGEVYDVTLNGVKIRGGVMSYKDARAFFDRLRDALAAKAP